MLLAFRVDRLRRAAAASGLNEAGLAGKAGVSRNTIAGWFGKEIAQGEVARKRGRSGPVLIRARSEVLSMVAEAVAAPLEWLTGELEHLPFVPRHGLLASGMGARKPVDPEDVGEAKLAHSLLLWRVDQAVRRDLRRWNAEDQEVATGVRLAVDELASVVQWRLFLLQPADGDPGAFLGKLPQGKRSRRRRGHPNKAVFDSLSMVRSVSDILEPWFDDAATLDAFALHQIVRPLFGGDGKLIFVTRSERHEANMHRVTVLSALVRYATLACAVEKPAIRPASSARSRGARSRRARSARGMAV